MTMRIASYEYFDKYKAATRIRSTPGIDVDVPVLFGRTVKEWLISIGIFIICAVFNKPFIGIIISIFIYTLSPFYRNKIDPAFISHMAWSLGLRKSFFKKRGAACIFTYKKYFAFFGP